MNRLSIIQQAFSQRERPKVILLPEYVSVDVCEDINSFIGQAWENITGNQMEKHFEVIFWFTPEAFCYYLPGFMSAGIRENNPELIINHSLVNMLDRGPEKELWDDFFVKRWSMLRLKECEAVQEWLLWLSSCGRTSFSDNSLSRAFDTLSLLKSNDSSGSGPTFEHSQS